MIEDFLRRILQQVADAVDEGHYKDFAEQHEAPPNVPSLEAAIRRDAPWALIAEAKPSSPSQGRLGRDAGHIQNVLRTYRDHEVTGISVLTERSTFGGSLELLRQAAQSGGTDTRIPVLMKDFVLHEDQLAAARAAGASAVLILHRVIAKGATPWAHPDDAITAAHKHGLEVLYEVDNGTAFEHAADTKAEIIGINNRDLGTLEMDPDRAIDILRHRMHLVQNTPVLSLSGIENRADVLANHQGGTTGVLVGTSLMSAPDPRTALRRLRASAHIKTCGAGHPEDPEQAVQALGSADAVGVVVMTDAPRNREPHDARALFDRLPPHSERVLVTTHKDVHELAALVEETGATHLQWHREATPEEHKALRDALPQGTHTIALLRLEATQSEVDLDPILERAQALTQHANRILLDAKPRKGDPPGGTGHTTDHALAARIVDALRPYPVVLAGGLTPETIPRALRQVRPWGIDVSSGTEEKDRPGRKDPARVSACIHAARCTLNLDQTQEEVDRLRVL